MWTTITRTTRFEDLPDLLSAEEARSYLAIGRSTLYDLLRRKEMICVRFGRVIRIPKAALETYINGEESPQKTDGPRCQP